MSAKADLDACLALLGVDGTMVSVGAPAEPLSLAVVNLLAGRRFVAGSATGGMAQAQEMLELCAEHGLRSEVELIAADGISEAEERVLASDVRYRFVIDIDMLG